MFIVKGHGYFCLIETKNSATVSRVIKDAVSSGLVKPYDSEAGAKAMRYVPHWS
ncbi:transcriptional regulator [Vibrio splendidus]|uniref:hypothetical protein n=1 Tax=Vibrio splendidus TaxID=29497 RepID=UPI0003139A7E|nr:hypothetical protein [Vibrio splendidus]PTP59248.1 transcriptional regulator [Vibrio splendidus]